MERKGDTEEGKPAQTNALASLFFARLYAVTGNAAYRDWALKTQLWLDTILWDPNKQLYRWSVGFTDIPHRTGAKIQNRYFNYDQGIAIESLLAQPNSTACQSPQPRARGRAHPPPSGRQAGRPRKRVSTSPPRTQHGPGLGHLALYAGRDAAVAGMARQNADGLASRLRAGPGRWLCLSRLCMNSSPRAVRPGRRPSSWTAPVYRRQAGSSISDSWLMG